MRDAVSDAPGSASATSCLLVVYAFMAVFTVIVLRRLARAAAGRARRAG